MPPPIHQFRPFVGYTEPQWHQARAMWTDVGFIERWADDTICEIDTGNGRFLANLNPHHDVKRAGMMHLWVENVDDWWAHIEPLKLQDRFPGVKVAAPSVTDWNWRLVYIWDPGGWLFHIGQPNE